MDLTIGLQQGVDISDFLKNKDYLAKKSTGRPIKLTQREEQQLIRIINKDPKSTPKRVRTIFNSFSVDKTIYEISVRRIVKRYGLNGRSAAKAVNLSLQKRQNRLNWCRQRRKRSIEGLEQAGFF